MFRPAIPCLVAIAALLSARAGASPLEDPTVGGAVFTGPTHPHATSIYLNPAALSLGVSGHHGYLGGGLRVDAIDVDRRLVDPQTGETSAGPSASDNPLSPGGTLAYYYTGPRVSGGVAVHTPFAETFVSGPGPLRYHALGGHHYQTLLSGGGALRVVDEFIFGASLSLAYTSFELAFARDTALEAGPGDGRGIASDCGGSPCGLENPLATQRYRLDAGTGGIGDLFDAKNIALTVGAMYQIQKGWWLGASFLQPPGGFGDLDLPGTARIETAPRDGERTLTGDTELTYRMPQTAYLGLRGAALPGYDLVLGIRWQNSSRHDQLDIRLFGDEFEGEDVPDWYPRYRGFKDTVRLDAGLESRANRRLRLGGRVRLETGAVDQSGLSPLQVAGPSATFAGALQFRLVQHLVLTANYELAWYPAGTSDPSAFDPLSRLQCVESGYAFDACEAARAGRALPTAAGRYRRLRHALAVSIRYDSL